MLIRFFNTYEPVTPLYRDLLPNLVAAGFEVEVILSAREYRAARGKIEAAVDSDATRIRRLPAPGAGLPGPAGKAMAAFGYALGAASLSLFGRRADLNVFLTQPPMFVAWGSALRAIRGQPYLCVLMDIYPDLAIQMRMLRPGSLAGRFLARLSRAAWRRAAANVAIGRCMRGVLERDGIGRVRVIPNWSDEAQIVPVPATENPLRREWGLDGKFVVLYSGNMGRAHRFEGILAAASALQSTHEIRFVFIGSGARRAEIESYAGRHGLGNVLLFDPQPEAALCYTQSLGDIHFISLRDEATGLVVPSKAYSAIAAGRPIVYEGSERGEIAMLINEHGIGAVVAPGDDPALIAAIESYHRGPAQCAEAGRRARHLAETVLGRGAGVEAYRRVIAEQLGGGT